MPADHRSVRGVGGTRNAAEVEECAKLWIKHVWMQPGAESDAAIRRGRELGLSVIAGGPCLLVVLGFSDA